MSPRFAAKISQSIGVFILFGCAIYYTNGLLRRDIAEVGTTALGAIGIIGALSAICFSFWACLTEAADRDIALYAGEKFFHSCLMVIQTLFAKYLYSGIVGIAYVKNTQWLNFALEILFTILFIALSSYAVFFAHWGFEEINKTLWSRYERRRTPSPKA